jgi:hypothetical protein
MDYNLTDAEWLRIVSQTEEKDGCMLWKGCKQTTGYGVICYRSKCTTTHRLMLQNKLGRALQPGTEAAHSCRNRNCINPDHLSEKTSQENKRDKITDGTWGQKMTQQQAHDVLYSTDPPAVIAARNGCSVSTVYKIKNGKTWKHIAAS